MSFKSAWESRWLRSIQAIRGQKAAVGFLTNMQDLKRIFAARFPFSNGTSMAKSDTVPSPE